MEMGWTTFTLAARSGRPADGIRLVQDRAAAGDAEAMFILANWRFWGLYGPKDLGECHALLERSADAGWGDAALLRANLINNGTGRPPDPEVPGRWMAGSEGFRRTRPFEGGEEKEATKRIVHIAITYTLNGSVTAYLRKKL